MDKTRNFTHLVLPFTVDGKSYSFQIVKKTPEADTIFLLHDYTKLLDGGTLISKPLAKILLTKVKYRQVVIDDLGLPISCFLKIEDRVIHMHESDGLDSLCEKIMDSAATAQASFYHHKLEEYCTENGNVPDEYYTIINELIAHNFEQKENLMA